MTTATATAVREECNECRYSYHDFDFASDLGRKCQAEWPGLVNMVQVRPGCLATLEYRERSTQRFFPAALPGDSVEEYAARHCGPCEVIEVGRFCGTRHFAVVAI